MKIREATAADLAPLVSLTQLVQTMHADAFPEKFRKDPPDEVVADAFRAMIAEPEAYWLVAEKEQEVVAYLNAEFRQRDATWCTVSHRSCYLGGVVVAPEFRRKGVARELLEALKTEAQARGFAQIELDVWAFNSVARETFAELGFQPMMEKMSLPTE